MKKENKRVFAQPECRVIRFRANDVICTSGEPSYTPQREDEPDDFIWGGNL